MSFSDSLAYVDLIDTTYYFPPSDWFDAEPMSKVLFLIFRGLTQNGDTAVGLGHYFTTVFFLVGCLAIFPPSQGNWRGLLVAYAIFGPQLAFVTIRATPAYVFSAIAVLEAVRGRNRCFAWIGAAALFHVSAMLALIPVFALIFKSHFKVIQKLQEPKLLFTLLLLTLLLFIILSSVIFSSVESLLSSIPYLSKYKIFLVGLSDDGGVSNLGTYAFGHYLFLLMVTAFFFVYVTAKDPITRVTSISIVAGYLFYILMFFAFSPIAAFRQTPFWLLPAFSLFPWHRIGWTGPGQIPFFGAVVGIFSFQFVRVPDLNVVHECSVLAARAIRQPHSRMWRSSMLQRRSQNREELEFREARIM